MALVVGSRLGPYEILALIGAGGMGEVYRARDTRLDRTVAIKVLVPHRAGDERVRQRFEREARTVSSLSHPNICALYDVGQHEGVDFIVLEYLEGETLAQRLARGQLPVREGLRHAADIADALDKAHRSGVVHRDLKPSNIMLTKSGPKLLDFGLAALSEPATPIEPDQLSKLATVPGSESLTVHGALLGTLPYMAPEQVEGKEADARTDVFALGANIFEMLTGRRAFEGKTRANLLAAILERDPPPISTLRPTAPPSLDRLVGRCLAKDPEDRWQTARDLELELNWIAAEGSRPNEGSARTGRGMRRERLGWVAVIGFLALGIVWLASGSRTPRSPTPQAVRFSLEPPSPESVISDLAVSPDGGTIAMVVWNASGTQLWVRPLDSLSARALPGTEGVFAHPFWSPDGRFLGFFAQGKLMKVALEGGVPQVLCTAPTGSSGTWNREGTILFGGASGGLQGVSAAGGEPKPIEPPDSTRGLSDHLSPYFLPDGRHFLYLNWEEERSGIMVGALDSDQRTRILDGLHAGVYAPPGYLLFVRDGTLMSQPFDAVSLRLSGQPIRVADHVTYADRGSSVFSISGEGVLAYASENPESRLVWFDRSGREVGQLGDPADYLHLDLSPDGTRLAVERGSPLGEGAEHDIWILDLAQGTSARFTFDPDFEGYPTWSPDGSRIAYLAHRNGKFGLYQKPASGAGEEELLLSMPVSGFPSSFSPDGRSLVFESNWGEDAPPDLWILPLDGKRVPTPFERTPTWENSGKISPDGRWIAYNVRNDIFVQSFPRPGWKWQVAAGAGFPRWRRDGKELFYGTTKGEMMAVDVRADTVLHLGVPHALGRVSSARVYKNRYPYDVTADGKRFLVNLMDMELAPTTVVVNWTAEIKR